MSSWRFFFFRRTVRLASTSYRWPPAALLQAILGKRRNNVVRCRNLRKIATGSMGNEKTLGRLSATSGWAFTRTKMQEAVRADCKGKSVHRERVRTQLSV